MRINRLSTLTVTDEIERGLGQAHEGAGVPGRQIVGAVRVASQRVQLAEADQRANADDDKVNIGAFSQERLTNRLQRVVGRAVGDQYDEVSDVSTVTGRQRKHLPINRPAE